MSATRGDFGSFRFSSEELGAVDRVPFYWDVIGQMWAKVNFEPIGENFRVDAHFCRLPDLSLACVEGSAARVNRTRAMAEGSDKLVLAIVRRGIAMYSQLGREATVPAGSAVLLSDAEAHRMERTAASLLMIGVPRMALASRLSTPDATLMSVVPSSSEALRHLADYADLLINDPLPGETNELRRLVVNHVHDLVALSLGMTRDAAHIAAGRGLRAARMRAIKADIAKNLEEDVTVAALSMRHRISPRYIRKLFEGENTSLSQFVLGQRLIRVHGMLSDPRHVDRTIADVVLSAGFGDLSTFNREFRRHFGVTPSDVRRRR